MVSFDNTERAFAYKKTIELKKANFLFALMSKRWLVNIGVKLLPLAIKLHIPFTKAIIRNTIFQQFVGGGTLDETALVANKLEKYGVQVILDYGVEGGKDNLKDFQNSTNEFISVIDYAATQANIPFMSIKVTGFSRFELLEKLNASMKEESGSLMKRYLAAVSQLSSEENEEWHRIRLRLLRICSVAADKKIGVLVDAEETWIQDPVDALTILMMDTFNKQRVVIFNTVQLYRNDRLKFLHDMYEAAAERDFILGVKIVRGAYMEKERKRAAEMNYPSPIQPDKETCDKDYNAALEFCISKIHQVSLIVASHNERSNLLTTQILQQKNIPFNHPHIYFSQLYGMSDNITFNLAKEGYKVSKYLPFGPIKDVIPYLMRRAQENTSVSGQTNRELSLIKKELKRRSQNNS